MTLTIKDIVIIFAIVLVVHLLTKVDYQKLTTKKDDDPGNY